MASWRISIIVKKKDLSYYLPIYKKAYANRLQAN